MEIDYQEHTINIEQDDETENPREWGTLGIIAYSHRDYKLGEEEANKGEYEDCTSWDDVKRVIEEKGGLNITPLYLYDHSGITIKTTPFGDRWDSGQVGFIYTTKEKMKEWGCEHQTKETIDNYLQNEIKTFDQYLTGDVYRITITGYCCHDILCGFYGMDEAEEEAKSIIDAHIRQLQKEKQEKLKNQIKHHAPLSVRA